jgi:alkanesulfonate monooxygenase SsuD/methylene tetrahydromethanopterin reductase-like flavin-dependent oxidoreductase (luciferase family)
MAQMDFGVVVHPTPRGGTVPAMQAMNERLLAAATEYDLSCWVIDHFQFDAQPVLECYAFLAYHAGKYPGLRWGNLVLGQGYRNPALTAKIAASLQFLTGGRYILGIGAGWKEDEYRAYGYDFPPAGVRVEELEETLQIIKALWTEERATVEGKRYQVREAWCEPKPDPLPTVMVGGSKPRMLRVVARHADWWNVSWTGIADYRKQVAECERACAEMGRDPATLRRTWFGGCVCGESEAEVARLNVRGISKDNAFAGTPEQVIEQMAPFVELGVDYFMLSCGGFPDLTTLRLLRDEVLPALNRQAR